MKKLIIGVIIVVAIVLGVLFGGRENATNEQVVKIGAILPLTGDLAIIGEELHRGMQLAMEDFADEGLTLVTEDDQSFDSRAALDAAQKLIEADGADIILSTAVTTAKSLAPVLNTAKVPGIIMWDSTPEVPGLGEYVFSMGYSVQSMGRDMAEFMYGQGERKVAVISAQEEWSEISSTAFVARFTDLGGDVVIHEKAPLDRADYKTNIVKLKSLEAEALYIPLFTEGLNRVIRQARELGFEGEMYAGDVFSVDNIAALGALTEGVHLTQLWLEDEEFASRYAAKFGSADSISLVFAGMGYDAISAVAKLKTDLEEGGAAVDSEGMAAALETFAHDGITGKTRLNRDHVADKHESILKLENGDFVLIKKL